MKKKMDFNVDSSAQMSVENARPLWKFKKAMKRLSVKPLLPVSDRLGLSP
jgi:hypothetical protein